MRRRHTAPQLGLKVERTPGTPPQQRGILPQNRSRSEPSTHRCRHRRVAICFLTMPLCVLAARTDTFSTQADHESLWLYPCDGHESINSTCTPPLASAQCILSANHDSIKTRRYVNAALDYALCTSVCPWINALQSND